LPTALVTGATAGIGKAFAQRLAGDGYALVLVARDGPRLAALAAELRARNGVDVETMAADLADRQQLQRVADRLGEDGRPVDMLVSNAGFAVAGPFLEAPVADEERMLDVLTRAVLVLARAAAPGMIARGRGTIVTVSSVAGFFPGGAYAAAKSWATAFTVALAAELAGTGVTATALCPGFVRTEFHRRAHMDVSRLPAWAWLSAERVVADGLADARRGRSVSVPSGRYKMAVFVARHLPLRWLGRLAARRAGAGAAARSAGRTGSPTP
jgi:uncharacterized protein